MLGLLRILKEAKHGEQQVQLLRDETLNNPRIHNTWPSDDLGIRHERGDIRRGLKRKRLGTNRPGVAGARYPSGRTVRSIPPNEKQRAVAYQQFCE